MTRHRDVAYFEDLAEGGGLEPEGSVPYLLRPEAAGRVSVLNGSPFRRQPVPPVVAVRGQAVAGKSLGRLAWMGAVLAVAGLAAWAYNDYIRAGRGAWGTSISLSVPVPAVKGGGKGAPAELSLQLLAGANLGEIPSQSAPAAQPDRVLDAPAPAPASAQEERAGMAAARRFVLAELERRYGDGVEEVEDDESKGAPPKRRGWLASAFGRLTPLRLRSSLATAGRASAESDAAAKASAGRVFDGGGEYGQTSEAQVDMMSAPIPIIVPPGEGAPDLVEGYGAPRERVDIPFRGSVEPEAVSPLIAARRVAVGLSLLGLGGATLGLGLLMRVNPL